MKTHPHNFRRFLTTSKTKAWMAGLCLGPLCFATTYASYAAPPEARQLSSPRAGNCEFPQWSRNGRSLAYERIFVEERRIELNLLRDAHQESPKEERIQPRLDDREGAATRVVSAFKRKEGTVEPGQICRELVWGPREAPDTFIYSCNVSGAAYQLFMTEGDQITRGSGISGQADLTVSGWRLAYIRARDGAEGIFAIFNLLEQLQPVALLARGKRLDRMPTWSPDGRALAFVGHSRRGADLYVMKNVQSAQTAKKSLARLTKWKGDETNPSWSPDGRRLAFYSDRKQGKKTRRDAPVRYGIYVLNVDKGGRPFLLASDVAASEHSGPAWTPDGRHIVFVKDVQRGALVDPIHIIAATPRAKERPINTQTVANRDPRITTYKGRWVLAFSALGPLYGGNRTWRKIYTMDVDFLRGPARSAGDGSAPGD